MDRRTFLSALGLLAAPLAARAQQVGKVVMTRRSRSGHSGKANAWEAL
jgi:hypothetical protein